jgi:5-methylcytosine-specific restriction endonuclease McrA
MSDTPGIQRASKPCAACNRPIPGHLRHCPTCSRTHNQRENQRSAKYQTPHWQQQRRRIIERDHHQCVLCARTERLHVHHLDHDADTHAVPDDRLVTLCGGHHSCHMQIEYEYRHHGGIGLMSERLMRHLRDSPVH